VTDVTVTGTRISVGASDVVISFVLQLAKISKQTNKPEIDFTRYLFILISLEFILQFHVPIIELLND